MVLRNERGMTMKRWKGVSLLLTLTVVMLLLAPVTMAVQAAGQNASGLYVFQTDCPEDPERISKSLKEDVRNAARRTGLTTMSVASVSKDEAEEALGIQLVSNAVFDAMETIEGEGYEDKLTVDYTPSLKIKRTSYERIRKSGDTTVTLRTSTLWATDAMYSSELKPAGKSVTETVYTAQNGTKYTIYQVEEKNVKNVWNYTVFQRGSTNYVLYANNAQGVPQQTLPSLLDAMQFPA